MAVRALLLLLALAGIGLGASACGGPEGRLGDVTVDGSGARLTLDLAGRVTRVGSLPAGRRRVVVSPDGRWQAVLHLPGTSGNTGTVAIGRHRPGAPLRVVERHLYVGTASVSWSSDSHWLAMVVWVPHLLSAVAVGTDGRRVTLAAPLCGDFRSGLAWEPRGSRVALGVPAPGTGCARGIDLRVRTPDSHGHVIAHDISGTPAWSADGRWIATTGGGVEELRADGSRRRQVGYGVAAWSTRGYELAVVNEQDETLTLGDAASARRAWDRPVDLGVLPAFSPDGRLLAYCRAGGIFVRAVEDRHVVMQVAVSGDVHVYDLDWAPRGDSLVIDARAVSPD